MSWRRSAEAPDWVANVPGAVVGGFGRGLSAVSVLPHVEQNLAPARLVAPHLMIYDTVYSSGRTPFVSAAIEAGARGANGLSMLIHQGALSFQIWFERQAPLDAMRQALL